MKMELFDEKLGRYGNNLLSLHARNYAKIKIHT